jgi:hypothetical protein
MSWTYTDNPLGDPRDALRLRVGDINEDDQLLSDAQCDYFLALHPDDLLLAAIKACEAIAARLAGTRPSSVGEADNPPQDRAKVFLDLADKLRIEAELEEAKEEKEEAEAKSLPRPGYSSAALNRKALFWSGIGYDESVID